jgi:serine/threonine-protein kinase
LTCAVTPTAAATDIAIQTAATNRIACVDVTASLLACDTSTPVVDEVQVCDNVRLFDMPLTVGSRIGPYEVLATLGEGGMGEVYRARDQNLGRAVALKVLPEAFAQDGERLARFEREAKTLAALSHPNIAIVHGFEKDGAIRALVMELVEGPTLADRIAQGPIPLDEAVPLARQIAAALEAAHEQGIIHRDLKPANIKVRDDGTVKVLDFGLAKMLEGPAEAGHYLRDSRSVGLQPDLSQSPTITTPAMTMAGVILGTAAYMSPEQARGKPVDKRSDVWAFGCVLFEMLTGRRAFDGEDVTDTIAAVVRAEPHWDALSTDVPEPIRLLLRRCLEKDRRKRIADISTASFLMTEGSALSPTSSPARGGSPGLAIPFWKRALPVLAGCALTAAIVAGIAWRLRPTPPASNLARFSLTLPDGQQFTNAGRPLVAISPDGTRIAYVANRRLYLRSLSDTRPREIQGTEESDGVTTPAFSPDGQWIAFVSGGDRMLKRISVDGGVAVPICPIVTSMGVSWGPQGILFGQRPGQIFRVAANGGKPELILTPKDGEAAYGPQILPSGDAMLVTIGVPPRTANSELLENTRVVWRSLKTSDEKTLVEHGADPHYVASGHIVYADGGALLAIRFDVERGQTVGDSVPIVQGVRRAVASPAAQFAVSDNGTLVYVPGSVAADYALAFLDRQRGQELLKLRNANYSVPRLSPDGTRIVVSVNDGKQNQVLIYDLSGKNSIRQLTLEGENRFPVWSPDGQRVAFESNRGGDEAIWWQRADGSGSAERLTRAEKGVAHAPFDWHPRDRTLLYGVVSRDARQSVALWTLSLADGTSKSMGVESSAYMGAQFSPDGRWLAYSLAQPGRTQSVFVRPYPGMESTYPIAPGTNPMWSSDGTELFFGRASTLYATRISTQPVFANSEPAPVETAFFIPGSVRNFDTRDGKRFLAVVAASESEVGRTVTQQIDVVLNWFEEVKRLVPPQ